MIHTTPRSVLAGLLAFATLVLAACSSAPPLKPADPEPGILAPNANLLTQQIPPVPLSLVQSVARYTEFSGHTFLDWHPSQREMLITHRKPGRNTAQLYRLTGPMAEPEALTDLPDPVTSGSYEPRDGRFIVFARSSGGNEADQLYRLDLDTRVITLLTDTAERHEFNLWLHGRARPNEERPTARFLSASVPLDRTAQQGSRASINTRLWLTDPLQPELRRLVAELPGGGWGVSAISDDDAQVALNHYISAN